MKTICSLVLLLTGFSVFAGEYEFKDLVQTADSPLTEAELIQDYYAWNGPFTEQEIHQYLQQVAAVGSGSGRSGGVMSGKANAYTNPSAGGGAGAGLKWGPCPAGVFSQTRKDWTPTAKPGWFRNPAYQSRNGGAECAKL